MAMALPDRPRERMPVSAQVVVGLLAVVGVIALVRVVLHLVFGLLFGLAALVVGVLLVGALLNYVLRPR
jgi:hypothetical protein